MSEDLPTDPVVALVAGDEEGLGALQPAREILESFGVAWMDAMVPPGKDGSFDSTRLRAVIVASADAVLPARLASGVRLPLVRVPTPRGERTGISLLQDPETANLPGGDEPFATVAIGEAGARNAALLVVSILGLTDRRLWAEWLAFRQRQTDAVLTHAPLAYV